jgi:peptide/nickel transport system substrate-binding protein
VDWWELPPLDFIPKIEQNPDLQTFVTDPLGTQGWLKPNFLHPPFNNKKAREALLHMMDQVTYLALAIGQSDYYRPCHSVFACRGPYATTIGAEPIIEHDLTIARQLVKESGYEPADRSDSGHRYRISQRRGARHAPATGVDRLQSHSQGNGLVDEPH